MSVPINPRITALVANSDYVSTSNPLPVELVGEGGGGSADFGAAITGESLEAGGSGNLGWLSSIRKKFDTYFGAKTTESRAIATGGSGVLGHLSQMALDQEQCVPILNTQWALNFGTSQTTVIDCESYRYRGVFARAYIIGRTASVTFSVTVALSADNANFFDVGTAAAAALGTANTAGYCLSRYVRFTVANTHASINGDVRVIIGLHK